MKYTFFFFFILFSTIAKEPEINKQSIMSPPPRIIRTCCSFGLDVKVAGLPFVKVTNITNYNNIGPHTFMGSKEEQNGIIYTQHGGFIDLGHLRDMADYTGYLYKLIQEIKGTENFSIKLGNEAGQKTLLLNVPSNLSSEDAVLLSGKIAYDISIWHEISTWYGASYIPLLPERYSSFSIEDAYSNLLGVHLGMQALRSKIGFEESMTNNLKLTLENLGVFKEDSATHNAMKSVKDIWWSTAAKLPSRKVLILRQFNVYDCVYPLLIDEEKIEQSNLNMLCVPITNTDNQSLDSYYELRVDTNFKIPLKKIYNLEKLNRKINQKDFQALIKYAEQEDATKI